MKTLVPVWIFTAWLATFADAQPLSELVASLQGSNLWSAATGILPERMVLPDTSKFSSPVYRTLWKKDDGNFLFCLCYTGLELVGTPYDVVVLNTNMQVIRRGDITAYQDDTPFCIVEVMTDSQELPEALRNKWLLAVGFWENHYQEAMKLTHGKTSTNSPEQVKAALEKLPSEFYFELVWWKDDPVKPKYGTGNLTHASNLKIRWVEQGPDILWDANKVIWKPNRFEVPKDALETARKRAKAGDPPKAATPQR